MASLQLLIAPSNVEWVAISMPPELDPTPLPDSVPEDPAPEPFPEPEPVSEPDPEPVPSPAPEPDLVPELDPGATSYNQQRFLIEVACCSLGSTDL